MHAFGPARLGRASQANLGKGLPNQLGRAYCLTKTIDGREVSRRVQIENEVVRAVPVIRAHKCRVVLNRALVREPQQGPAVVAERVSDLAVRRLRPQLNRLDKVRGV